MIGDAIARNEVLFIHGGGEGGYEADAPLAASLRQRLGTNYNVRYPRMPDDESSPDFGWVEKIFREIAAVGREVFLVGHSLGASMILKCLSENRISGRIPGVFLLATPFWSGSEEWQKGLMLRKDFASALPRDISIFLYHSQDDQEVDTSSLDIYKAKLPQAITRKPVTGGHQFGNDLALVAGDIQSLVSRAL